MNSKIDRGSSLRELLYFSMKNWEKQKDLLGLLSASNSEGK
jgi:hypothetical protein